MVLCLCDIYKKMKETISVIHCDELYIVMRITETIDTNDGISIETKYTKTMEKHLVGMRI